MAEGEGEPLARDVRDEPEEARAPTRARTSAEAARPRVKKAATRGRPDWTQAVAPTPARRRSAAEEAERQRRRDRLGVPAEDARRRDAAHGEEGRDPEDERDAEAEADAAEEGLGLPRVETARGEEVGVGAADGRDEPDARRRRRGGSRGAEPRRLRRVEEDRLARRDAEAAEDREGVEAARDPGAHRLRDADAADEERRERDEAEEAGRPPDRLRAARAGRRASSRRGSPGTPSRRRFSALDASVALRRVGPLREVQEDAAGDAAAEAGERRPRESLAGDEDARADPERAGEAVGLGDDRPRDAEPGSAEGDLAADGDAEPAEEVGMGDDRVGSEEGREGPVGLEAELARRAGRAARRPSARRGGCAAPSPRTAADVPGSNTTVTSSSVLVRVPGIASIARVDARREGLERLDGEVGAEERARLAPDRLLERAGEPRDGDDGGDARAEAGGEEEEPPARPAALPRELPDEEAGLHDGLLVPLDPSRRGGGSGGPRGPRRRGRA